MFSLVPSRSSSVAPAKARRSVKGSDVTGRGRECGEEVDYAVHEHEHRERDFKGKRVHYEPVFQRFEKPDQHTRHEDHDDIFTTAQAFQAIQEPCR